MPTERRGTTARTPLTRERVLAAALDLADAEGIESLTMRRLGQELGVEAMSLYNHVANKDDLLDGMVDAVFAEIDLPDPEAPWAVAMADRARSLRAVLLHHRWAVGLMDARTFPGPATLRHHDAVLGCSRRAGFNLEMAAHAFSLIDSFVYGFVLQEVTMPFEVTGEVDEASVAAMMADVEPDVFPYLAELTVEHVMAAGYNFADEFEFGLDIVLSGLEAAAAGVHRPRPSPTATFRSDRPVSR